MLLQLPRLPGEVIESSGLEKITCKIVVSGECSPGEGAGGHPVCPCTWQGCGKNWDYCRLTMGERRLGQGSH